MYSCFHESPKMAMDEDITYHMDIFWLKKRHNEIHAIQQSKKMYFLCRYEMWCLNLRNGEFWMKRRDKGLGLVKPPPGNLSANATLRS